MIQLFEFPPTRSQRAKWALEEVGLAYESMPVNLPGGEQDGAGYRAIHPLGNVPALKTDSYTMHESVAIVLQLIDEHPDSGLAPPPGTPERAHYYQWCVFAAAEIDPAIMAIFDNTMRPLESMRPKGASHNPEIAERGRRAFEERALLLSRELEGRDYLVGGAFSGADILVGHSCFMAGIVGLIGDYPVLQRYHAQLAERPAYRRAYPEAGRP